MIKKRIIAAASAAMMLMSAVGVQCADDVKVMLDGAQLTFDVPPQIISDRTFVPLRVIFEAMGAEVSWDGEERKVSAVKDDTTVEMTIDSTVMTVNAQEITLDVPPQIVDDRTLVPARAVAESFGAEVAWDGETRTVTITSAATAATPAPTAAPASKFPIEYNGALENKTSYLSNFKLTKVEKNADGDYDIEYTLQTFFEGRGTVSVEFNCLDASGKIVDTFGGSFIGSDYAWSPHESSATISGDTVLIEVNLD